MADRNTSARILRSIAAAAPAGESGNLGMGPQRAGEQTGLLDVPEWMTKAPEKWTKAQLIQAREWDQAAIRDLETELAEQRASHARRKPGFFGGLLGWTEAKTRGRPRTGPQDAALAQRALEFKAELAAQLGRRVPDN